MNQIRLSWVFQVFLNPWLPCKMKTKIWTFQWLSNSSMTQTLVKLPQNAKSSFDPTSFKTTLKNSSACLSHKWIQSLCNKVLIDWQTSSLKDEPIDSEIVCLNTKKNSSHMTPIRGLSKRLWVLKNRQHLLWAIYLIIMCKMCAAAINSHPGGNLWSLPSKCTHWTTINWIICLRYMPCLKAKNEQHSWQTTTSKVVT